MTDVQVQDLHNQDRVQALHRHGQVQVLHRRSNQVQVLNLQVHSQAQARVQALHRQGQVHNQENSSSSSKMGLIHFSFNAIFWGEICSF